MRGAMRGMIVRRVLQSAPLLVLISVLVFALLQAVPGGPLAAYLENPNVRPQDIERLRAAMGLDRPLAAQYVSWLSAFVRGDWGYSFADGRPVLDRVLERVPATLELVGASTTTSHVGFELIYIKNMSFGHFIFSYLFD